jgi:DNA-binding XRE family transcriptional regulator
MSLNEIKAARATLGSFFKDRRIQMGRTQKEVADFLGLTKNTINGIESGRFAWDIDLNHRLCEALEIKPFYAPHEYLPASSMESTGPRFLLCPDPDGSRLYILHRHFPVCLVEVSPTTPESFHIVDLYDDASEKDFILHPFWEDLMDFWASQIDSLKK